MDVREYTDEEVIKGLEVYAERQCNKCAIKDLRRFCGSCFINVIKQAPRVINRQKKELSLIKRNVTVEIFADIAREMAKLLPLRKIRLITGRSVGKSFELGREEAISDVLNLFAELEKKYTEGE